MVFRKDRVDGDLIAGLPDGRPVIPRPNALQDTVVTDVKEVVSTVVDRAEDLGNMLSETEDTNVKMKDLAKDMLKSMVKMTIKLMAEELTRMVTKEIYRKEDEANELMHQQMLLDTIITFGTLMNTAQATIDTTRLTEKSAADTTELTTEVSKTSAEVPLGIAQGAAKTIGSLGWWGIPLIAVISALLMGLLSWAISAAFGSSDSKSCRRSSADA